jgi:osmotically-inducible protein OsmY
MRELVFVEMRDGRQDVTSVHSSNNIGVQNGVVTLTGHVASYAEKLAAERASRRVAGVRVAAEEIDVRYP